MIRVLFRRGAEMLESIVLRESLIECVLNTFREMILETVGSRFGPVPADISASVRLVTETTRLKELIGDAYVCASLNDFRARLTPPQLPAAN